MTSAAPSPIGIYHFSIVQDATWGRVWKRAGVSTATGWGAMMDIRAARNRAATLLHRLTHTSGGITLSSDGVNLVIALLIPQSATSLFTFETAYYDLKLTLPSGAVEYLLSGDITLIPTLTGGAST